MAAAAIACLSIAVVSCGGSTRSTRELGVPASLVAQSRPLGAGSRFHPPVPDRALPACQGSLGARHPVHIEMFAENRVVVLPAGIGTRTPRRLFAGRVVAARCYGDVVTLEPTGVALVRSGSARRLGELFRAWGMPLSKRALAGFRGRVRVYVDGKRRLVDPRSVPLSDHAQIVLEVGPLVPPHASFVFPPAR